MNFIALTIGFNYESKTKQQGHLFIFFPNQFKNSNLINKCMEKYCIKAMVYQ